MSRRRPALVGAVVIGVGLAVAPLVFQMFSRAPGGGRMIDAFAPYMHETRIDRFSGYLDRISAAHAESLGLAEPPGRYPAVERFNQEWPAIDADMSSMLGDIRSNIDEYRAVSALPPFALFPWFFVVPGLAVAGLAVWALRSGRPGAAFAVIVAGLAITAAPAVFQMFSRAPAGAAMVDDFRPLMRPERVTTIQGYFLTIGAAEGQLRTEVQASNPGGAGPAVQALARDWPAISADMAPMIGTMSDNLDNFGGVAALPPFGLFPWFFVVPGLLVAGLGTAARLAGGRPSPPEAPVAAGPVLERSVS